MTTVSVSRLKARLSEYVRRVKRGGEVQVTERGIPVARLVGSEPVASGDSVRGRLARSGAVRLGKGNMMDALKRYRPVKVSGARLLDALLDDRRDRF